MTLILPQLDVSRARLSDQERKRLEELYSLHVLDAASDERFNRYTELAASALGAPMASIVLLERNKAVIKSVHGRIVEDVPRESSFAAQAMLEPDLLIVEDTHKDARFAKHPLVRNDPGVRFYAGSVVRGPDGKPLGALCVMDTLARPFSRREQKILTQLARLLEHELECRAKVDELRQRLQEYVLLDAATQLPTEALFTARLAGVIETDPAKPTMLALIRLERFESIHSAIGKPGAAHLVRNAASRLKQALQRDCLIGQMREDTVAAAFKLADSNSPQTEINRILSCFTAPFLLGEHTLAQSVSIGTATHPHDGQDSETLIKRARTALNAMPLSDTSRFRQYDRRLSAAAARQFEIETALRGALERDELELCYQPKFSIESGALVGAEALLRWTTPRLGQVLPAEFVPIAEESGLIIELGYWALATASQQMSDWTEAGLPFPEISVNISSIQLRQPEFIRRINDLLSRNNIDGTHLNLEVTEGTLIENMSDAIRIMSDLRSYGISFSIDDFGKGFSSLSYLARMPVQILKIDRGFVERIPKENSSLTLVHSIIAMGHALGMKVVAEGVENEEQLHVLRKAACDHAQGYLFSQPIPARTFEAAYLVKDEDSAPS